MSEERHGILLTLHADYIPVILDGSSLRRKDNLPFRLPCISGKIFNIEPWQYDQWFQKYEGFDKLDNSYYTLYLTFDEEKAKLLHETIKLTQCFTTSEVHRKIAAKLFGT